MECEFLMHSLKIKDTSSLAIFSYSLFTLPDSPACACDVQILIVLMVIAVGIFEIDTSNWIPFAPNGYGAVITGVTVVFFAYVGFDAVANSAEESKNPQVNFSSSQESGHFLGLIISTIWNIIEGSILE
jgi:hypothetical protein